MNRLALLCLALAACGGRHEEPAKIAVQPPKAAVKAGASQRFAALEGGAITTAVDWSVTEGAGGTVDAGGLYTAPGAAGTFHVVATSRAAPSVSGSAVVTVTLPPNVVTISPAAPSIDACRTQQFSATTTRGMLSYAASGGTIDSTGLYTAPATGGTYTITATSSAGGSATATVTVTERIVLVEVAPATATVETGKTQQFTATVTTTCGAFTQSVTP